MRITNAFARGLGLTLLALLVCALPASAQAPYLWTDITNDGLWDDANDWNPNGNTPGVPGVVCTSCDVHVLNVAPLFSPTLTIPITLNNLTIDPSAVVTVGPPDGITLTLNGTSLSGELIMNNQGGAPTVLLISQPLTYTGGNPGIMMSDNSAITGSGTLTNMGTISYQGGVSSSPNGSIGDGLTVLNSGIITSGVSTPYLVLTPNAKWTNTGTIGVGINSFQGGFLQITGGTINQQPNSGPGGTIDANGGTISLGTTAHNAIVVGGSLATGNGGAINGCEALLKDLTINATYNVLCPIGGDAYTFIRGTITNNGLISLNGSASLSIVGDTTLKGSSGSVSLSNGARITGTDVSLINQQTISGSGSITVPTLTNQGTISAAGGTLTITPGSGGVTNAGSLTAANGATLEISGGTVNNASGYIFPASGGTVLYDNNVTINGGIVQNPQAQNATFNGTSKGITVSNVMIVMDGYQATLSGTINGSNNGGITVGNNTGPSATLTVDGNTKLNDITVVLPSNNNINTVNGNENTVTLGAGSGITGAGSVNNINLVLSQNSQISCNNASVPLTFPLGTTVMVGGKSVLLIYACEVDMAGTLENYNAATNTLTGGTYTIGGQWGLPADYNVTTVGSGTVVNWNGGASCAACNFENVLSGGTLNVSGVYSAPGSLAIAGTVTIDPTGSLIATTSGSNITQNGGTLTNNGALYAATEGYIYVSSGTLQGTTGTIVGNVNNGGNQNDAKRKNGEREPVSEHSTKAPTQPPTFVIGMSKPQQAGSVTITQNYTQVAAGTMDVFVGGTSAGTQYSQLNVTGSATLSGTLDIALIGGFVPQVGQVFTILNASEGISGTFTTVKGLSINSSEHFSIAYNSDSITLTVESGT